jgi:hypothetical protein
VRFGNASASTATGTWDDTRHSLNAAHVYVGVPGRPKGMVFSAGDDDRQECLNISRPIGEPHQRGLPAVLRSTHRRWPSGNPRLSAF